MRAIVSNYRDVTHRRQAEQHASELRLAQRIQQRLFPTLPRPAGYDVGAGSYPATATGGDYFDFLPLGDGGLGIVIGDVSGHGFGPALLMAEVHAYLRALALSYQENGRRSADGVGRLVSLLNQALNRELASDHFVTLMLGRLELATGNFVYVGAGHPWAYVLDAAGTLKARLKSSSLPVGILPDGDFAASGAVRLEAGDLVVFLTDGVLDARSGRYAFRRPARPRRGALLPPRPGAADCREPLSRRLCLLAERAAGRRHYNHCGQGRFGSRIRLTGSPSEAPSSVSFLLASATLWSAAVAAAFFFSRFPAPDTFREHRRPEPSIRLPSAAPLW